MVQRQLVVKAVVPFLAGLAAAPFVKPLLRGSIKASIGAAVRLRVLAAEAAEDLQDLTAEAKAKATG